MIRLTRLTVLVVRHLQKKKEEDSQAKKDRAASRINIEPPSKYFSIRKLIHTYFVIRLYVEL